MGANGQGPPIPTLPPVAQLQCIQCQTEFIVKVPPPRLFRMRDCTQILFVHPGMDKCPNCGQIYHFSIHHIEPNGMLALEWVPLQTQQSAIVPGTDKNLTQAVNNDEIAKKIKLQ